MVGEILAIGAAALGVLGSIKSRNAYNKQAEIYQEQERLNREIGAFNSGVAERTGIEAVNNIYKQTKRLVGDQMAAYTRRGIALEGSPLIVIGDTISMGSEKAQEAYFNAEVSRVNALYGAHQTAMTARAHAEETKGMARSKTMEIFQSVTSMGKAASGSGVFDSIFKGS